MLGPGAGPSTLRHGLSRLRPWLRRAPAVLYVVPALALYGTFVLWPLARTGMLAVEQWDGYSAPSFVGFDNLASLWADPGFPAELQHSLIWLVVTLTVPVGLGLVLALLLQGTSRRLRAPLRGLLILPLLLPTVLTAVAWRMFYNPLSGPLTSFLQHVHLGRLAGDWLGDPNLALPALLVAACWGSFGLSMLTCEVGLARLGEDVRDAARLDGAGALAQFWSITLPALRGVLPLAVVATGFSAIPSYDLVSLLTNGGPGYATTTLALDSYNRAFGGSGQIGTGAALGALQAVAGLALTVAALMVARGLEVDEIGLGEPPAPRRAAAQATVPPLVLVGLALVLLAPLAWLIRLAVQSESGGPSWTALGASASLVWDAGFGNAIATSLWAALVVGALATAVSIFAAFALAGSRSRIVKAAGAALLALGIFQLVPVLIFPLFDTIRSLGLLNTLPGVIAPQIGRAVAVDTLLLWVSIRSMPHAVLNAAAADGARPLSVLIGIVVPLSRPLLVVVAVWSFLLSWNDYLLPSVVLAAGGAETVPLALAHFVGSLDTEYSPLATAALVALLPIALMYAALDRVLARGLSRLRI